jgi:NAD(P)-dependent dehydrogenase (short-subunit alcohol dehydrogenase family)
MRINTYSHAGHFALVQALLPVLKHTAALPNSDVRVITVTSVAHAFIKDIILEKNSDLNVTFVANPSSIDSIRAKQDCYHFTKLLNILFVSVLQRRVDK